MLSQNDFLKAEEKVKVHFGEVYGWKSDIYNKFITSMVADGNVGDEVSAADYWNDLVCDMHNKGKI